MNKDAIRAKREDLRRAKSERPIAELRARVRSAPPLRPLPLRRDGGLALVAWEPSPALAPACEEALLEAAALATPALVEFRARSPLPVLRLEDVVDEYQVLETRVLPADGLRLDVALLDKGQLSEYVHHARELGLRVVVEAADLRGIEKAMDALSRSGDRDSALALQAPDLGALLALVDRVEGGRTIVSRWRPASAADVALARKAGVHAAAVGGPLWTDPDPAKALLAWRGLERRVRAATMEELP